MLPGPGHAIAGVTQVGRRQSDHVSHFRPIHLNCMRLPAPAKAMNLPLLAAEAFAYICARHGLDREVRVLAKRLDEKRLRHANA